MKLAKGNMKLKSMKRDAKRRHARKGRETTMIHKIPSVPFRKPGRGSISCQIGMPFDQSQGPMLEEGLNLQPEICSD